MSLFHLSCRYGNLHSKLRWLQRKSNYRILNFCLSRRFPPQRGAEVTLDSIWDMRMNVHPPAGFPKLRRGSTFPYFWKPGYELTTAKIFHHLDKMSRLVAFLTHIGQRIPAVIAKHAAAGLLSTGKLLNACPAHFLPSTPHARLSRSDGGRYDNRWEATKSQVV